MLNKLGFAGIGELSPPDAAQLLQATLDCLKTTQIGYHDFFRELRQQFSPHWRTHANAILAEAIANPATLPKSLETWRQLYQQALQQLPESAMPQVAQRLQQHNPLTVLLRPEIEAIWEPIVQEDNWQPFYQLLQRVQQATEQP